MEKQNANNRKTLTAFYNKKLQKYAEMKATYPEDPLLLKAVRAFEFEIEHIYRQIEEAEPGCLLSPGEVVIATLRERYPTGCTVVLDEMQDPQAPAVGTCGIVHHVDDIGTIHVVWDNGNRLGIAYGKDKCHRLYNVHRQDGRAISVASKYPSGSRIALRQELPDYDGKGNVLPCGSTGTVGNVNDCGTIYVRFDGVDYLIALTPGKHKFRRVWEETLPLPIIAEHLMEFCEKNHYRQNPITIGCWQPDPLLAMTIVRLYNPVGIRRILHGLHRFGVTLPQEERVALDKIRNDIVRHWEWVDPCFREAKELVNRLYRIEYQDSYGADFSNLHSIDLASTENEDGQVIEVTLDLIELKLITYVNGEIVEVLEYNEQSLLQELRFCDFDGLTTVPEAVGKGDAS